MRKLLHIGYFNDTEDLKMFYNASADEIINNMQTLSEELSEKGIKKGNFHTGIGAFYGIDEKMIYNESDLVGEKKTTTDNEYVVVSDLPIDMELLDSPNVCDFYIDVYKVINEDEDNPKFGTGSVIISICSNNVDIELYGDDDDCKKIAKLLNISGNLYINDKLSN